MCFTCLLLSIVYFFGEAVARWLDFHPSNLGLSSVTLVSYWWCQDELLAKISPMHHERPILHVDVSEPL